MKLWINRGLLSLLLLALLLVQPLALTHGYAQEAPTGAVYVVQSGDSLWAIATRFRVSMTDLLAANGLGEGSSINIGQRLLIPGLEGIQGELTTDVVPFGENLRSLSRRYNLPIDTLARLNHWTTPAELYAGTTLVLLTSNAQPIPARRALLRPGQSLLELAAAHNANPWQALQDNALSGAALALPGDVLRLPPTDPTQPEATGPGALPETITQVGLMPNPVIQGKAIAISLHAQEGLELSGDLIGHRLQFFIDSPGVYVGLQGIHAMTTPGLYNVVISGTLPAAPPYEAAPFAFSQGMMVQAGNYPFDPVLIVSPETIDPTVTQPEDAQWAALTAPVTPQRLWQDRFQSPAPPPYQDCWPSLYGNRRSYNGSPYTFFHTGLDFCGGVGTDILAPAAGRVVFAGPLTVRGNATIIDHGWGVYSAYLHQSELLVVVGDLVQPGQVIGKVGGTGRVTGPHLHWEIWAGGVQVDPMDWLEQTYPFGAQTTP